MNMELFDDYFKRDYCNYIERFLCLKMKELVLLKYYYFVEVLK